MDTDQKEVYIKRDVFTDIFINTNRFKIIENPTPFDQRYLEVLLQDPILSFQRQSDGDIDTNVIPLIVKALIISESRESLLLVDEDDKRKVTIPGGHVSTYRMEEYPRGMELIEFNLIRELCEEFKIGRRTRPYTELNVPPLTEILDRGGFKYVSKGDPYYTLNERLGFTIYIPLYVEDWIYPDNAISVIVDEYKDLISSGKEERLLRYCMYDNDVRINECSYILKNIINTKQLFK